MNLPATMFITSVNEGTDDQYFQAEKSDEEFAEVGKRTQVGKYRLEEVFVVTAKRVVERKGARA